VETVVDGLRLRYVPWTADTSDGVQVWEACAECEDYEGWAYEVLHSLSDLGNWLVARYRLQCGEEIGTCDTPCRGHDQTFRR
jgi:hypothetical protein